MITDKLSSGDNFPTIFFAQFFFRFARLWVGEAKVDLRISQTNILAEFLTGRLQTVGLQIGELKGISKLSLMLFLCVNQSVD